MGAARSIAAPSPSGSMDHRFAQLIVSPNNLQFKDDAARDAMHQSWVSFCEQAPSTECLDAIIEGFVRRVRKDEDGNASFDAAALPLYWPRYTKKEESVVAGALGDIGNMRQHLTDSSCSCGYNWFRQKLGRRGFFKLSIDKLYIVWQLSTATAIRRNGWVAS